MYNYQMILKSESSNFGAYHVLSLGLLNTNDIREEIKRGINMENACYYSLEKILSSHLLYKKN